MDGNVDIFCFESNCDDRKVKLEENGNEISLSRVISKPEKYRDNTNKFQCHLCNEYFDQFELEMHFIECSLEENGNYVKNEVIVNIEDNDENETDFSCITQPDILAKRKRSATVRYNVDIRTITRRKFKKRGKIKKKIKTKERRNVKEFLCKYCDKCFQTSNSLLFHERSHTEDKTFKCELCSKAFLCLSQLQNHSKVHSEERTFKCKSCPKAFKEKRTLQRHEMGHVKSFICRICCKAYTKEIFLQRHIKLHPGGKLSNNQRIEEGENVEKNKQTKKKYSGRKKKKCDDQFNGDGDKIFQCDSCERTFNSSPALKYHKTTHLGENQEKPFKCEICSKAFPQKSGLNQHSFIHSGEKPFKCPKCPESFSRKDSLKKHDRTHTGEKPFECKYCDKAFAFKTALKTHEQLHTGKLLKCKRCSKRFTNSFWLESHIVKKHQVH